MGLPVEKRVQLPFMDWREMRGQAEAFVKSGLAPQSIRTPEQALLIAAAGREIGVPFMASLRSIDVIQGQTSLSAQLKLAKAMESGELEDMKIERLPDGVAVHLKRKGLKSYVTSRFGNAEATAMGLAGKDNYHKQAFRMYKWRALSEALDVAFADVMLGVHRVNQNVSEGLDAAAAAEEPEFAEAAPVEAEIAKSESVATEATESWPHPASTPPVEHAEKPPLDTDFMLKDINEKLAAMNAGDVDLMEAHIKRLTTWKARETGLEKWLKLEDLAHIAVRKPDWFKRVHKNVVMDFDKEFGATKS